jgi:hypothetical protein
VNKNVVANALSRIDIDSLKIQEEEVLTHLSGSESNSMSNIKLTIPMHNAMICKEQAKVKEQGLIEKGIGQPHSSIQQVVLQASQTAVVFYQLPSSIVNCTSGLLRLQLSSTNFHVQLLAVLQDFSGFNCLLPTFKCNG